MSEFNRIDRLPPYVFNTVNQLKVIARAQGKDVVDFGMGNPDRPTPQHIIDKLIESVKNPATHRYSMSRGIPRLRRAICQWYKNKFNVDLDEETEAIVTIGSKEGLAHLSLAMLSPGDNVLVPSPAYPIHPYGCVIAGADISYVPLSSDTDFFDTLKETIHSSWPKPKMLILNFPCNPTTHCVDIEFFEKIVVLAKEHNIWVVHDIAYAEIVFDGYQAPSILQVSGAKDIAVEFYSLSKTYNMPGWRVGFMCGNKTLVGILAKLKSYLDYGLFTPIQVAAITALETSDECVAEIRDVYRQRRDILCEGLNRIGWQIDKPKATMFVWGKIPESYQKMGSLKFAEHLLEQAQVAVSPGIGFGHYGDQYVRFSLIENEQRTRQALRNIKKYCNHVRELDETNKNRDIRFRNRWLRHLVGIAPQC